MTPELVAADVVTARSQMGASLGFHIILACFGIAFPALMLIANWIGISRHDAAALLLARRWSKITAILFAVGAVSGTVLSYEMGLLWPGLMGRFGQAIGIPFAVEGIFFFLEAIFTGIYLYGWDRLSPRLHLLSGLPIPLAGICGAMSVVAANAWMNTPSGFTLRHGKVVGVDPLSVYFNSSTPYEVPHMILAAYMVVGFTVAGVYAVGILRGRNDRYHRLGLGIGSVVGGVAAPLQILMGDVIARFEEHVQPVKFAAMELVPRTGRSVPEYLGGIWIHGHVYFGMTVPWLDSILVGFSPHTKVIGWDTVPADRRPPLLSLIHLSFDAMVAIGFALLALAAWQLWTWIFHRRLPRTPLFFAAMAVSGVGAIAAMECGWIVTEVGRQPWIIYKVLLVNDAVTPSSGVDVTLAAILVIYAVITVLAIGVPWRMSQRWRRAGPEVEAAETVPYAPPRPSPSSKPREPVA